MSQNNQPGLGRIFANTLLNVGKVGVRAAAHKQMTKRPQKKGQKDDGGCTPCAAKARGVEMANTIWK